MAELKLLVVTPEETLLDCQSEAVIVPMIDGQKGFLPGHAPMIGRLGPGVMKVQQGGGDRRFFLEGGFVQMDRNVLSVLTNIAIPIEELAVNQLQDDLKALDKLEPTTASEKLSHQRKVQLTKAMLQAANQTVGS
jgi:F-type H+-transporting ATPase subunit epsilon